MIIDIMLYQLYGRGGLETVLLHVSRGLKARGHRVRFMFHDPPIIEKWMEELDEVHICSTYSGEKNEHDYRDIFSIRYRNAIEQLGFPDIILATFRPIFGYMARAAFVDMPKEQHPPIISWIHGPPEAYSAPASHFIDADAHLAISYPVGQKIRALQPTSPIFFVGNPIIPLPPNQAQLIQRPAHLKLVYVGQIDTAVKGIPVMLEACRHLKGEWELELYGEGYERTAFINWCADNGIAERVHWKGWQNDVWSHVKEASVLVLPSNSEGFGMVLTEALQRGIPVVASDTDGAKEVVVPDVNGWMFKRGSSESLRSVLQAIIDGDRQLPSKEQCHHSVQIYDIEQVLDHFERVFDIMLLHKQLTVDQASEHAQAVASTDVVPAVTVASEQQAIGGLLELMNKQQPENLLKAAEQLYLIYPHSLYLASLLGQLHNQLKDSSKAHFYWKQVLMSTQDTVLRQVASKQVERLRG